MPTPITTVQLTDTFDVWRQRTNLVIGRFNNLGTYDAITIIGGTINGTSIGATTPSSGVFTTLTASDTLDASAASLILADNQISGDKISGGTIDSVTVLLAGTPTLNLHATTKLYVDTAISGVAGGLATVATTGSFNDLLNKPLIFKTIAVATQTSIVAASVTDTLTFAAGTNIAITTNAGTKTITISTTGLGSLATLNTINDSNWSGTVLSIGNGGHGQSTKAAGFNALSPLSGVGDTLYGGASGTGTRLAGNITATKKFLTQTGTGIVSQAPLWDTIVNADVAGSAGEQLNINAQTTSYTLVLADGTDTYVRINSGSSVTLTIPANVDVAFPIGTQIPIRQVGGGQVSVAAAGGVTINTPETTGLRKAGSTAGIIKVGTNEWDLFGDLQPA